MDDDQRKKLKDEFKRRLTHGLSFTDGRQRLLDDAAYRSSIEGIRQGLDDVAHGRTIPAKEVFETIRRKYGIPR